MEYEYLIQQTSKAFKQENKRKKGFEIGKYNNILNLLDMGSGLQVTIFRGYETN